MFRIINDELFSYEVDESIHRTTGALHAKIRVLSSNKILQYKSNSRQYREDYISPNENRPIVSKNDDIIPVNREIIRVSAPMNESKEFKNEFAKTYSVDFSYPMTLAVSKSYGNQQNVELRCHSDGADRANVYVIAFPFNGMIKPIAESKQYKIFKGLITSSVRPFYINNHRYRKVLYLVIEPNVRLFDPEHKYHTDKIDIPLESYALFTDKESGEQKTNYEKMTVSITRDDYSIDWEYQLIEEAVLMNAQPGQQLWTTYYVTNDGKERPQKKLHKGEHPKEIQGNTIVTTNRHGIRKEIPLNDNRGNRSNNYRNNNRHDEDDFEAMLRASGLYDDDGGKSRGSWNRNQGKRGKKGKKNRNSRYDEY